MSCPEAMKEEISFSGDRKQFLCTLGETAERFRKDVFAPEQQTT
jgi:hypothetical protein